MPETCKICNYQIDSSGLDKHQIPTDAFQLLPADRAATKALRKRLRFVMLIIPRGLRVLTFRSENSKSPVIENRSRHRAYVWMRRQI